MAISHSWAAKVVVLLMDKENYITGWWFGT
jgi:hypothetical protein